MVCSIFSLYNFIFLVVAFADRLLPRHSGLIFHIFIHGAGPGLEDKKFTLGALAGVMWLIPFASGCLDFSALHLRKRKKENGRVQCSDSSIRRTKGRIYYTIISFERGGLVLKWTAAPCALHRLSTLWLFCRVCLIAWGIFYMLYWAVYMSL
ncbi:hypothetical protein BJX70DRAFT_35892 [Aspergillus crustosus]